MINKVTFLSEKVSNFSKKQNQPIQYQNQPPVDTDDQNNKPNAMLLHSYFVSFGTKTKAENDKVKNLTEQFTPNAQRIWDNSIAIAKQNKHPEVSYLHLFKAILEDVNKYITDLNTGRKTYKKDDPSTIKAQFEGVIDPEIFKDKNKRERFSKIIGQEIVQLGAQLKKQKHPTAIPAKTTFNKDMINDINSLYQEHCANMDSDLSPLLDDVLLDSILSSANENILSDVAEPFIKKLQNEFMEDKTPIEEKPHIEFFDNKARDIWKNISLGTDMFLLYEENSNPAYLTNSFRHLMSVQKQKFSKFQSDNTEIVVLNKNTSLDYIQKRIEDAKKNKDKNTVIVLDFEELYKREDECLDDSNLEIFKEPPSNVKFLVLCPKDKYYSKISTGDYKKAFENFGDLSLPILNPDETKKVLKTEPVLTKKLGKKFHPKAIDRCVEFTHPQKGNYPEKALSLMKSIATYYVDKQDISRADVDKYIKEVRSSSKFESGDNQLNVVFDTKVRLKDIVGNESLKREVKTISDQIKKGTIGTKGFVISSQDGMPGSGRKYTAQAIAGEAGVPYIQINAHDFGTKEVNLFDEGVLSPEASIKKLFNLAKVQAEANPHKAAIIFIENFESFASEEFASEYDQKAFSQLLREMETANKHGKPNVIVMGSVNDPDALGESAMKSFKFVDSISIESPSRNVDARFDILKHYVDKKKFKIAGDTPEAKDSLIRSVAETTEYFPLIYLMLMLDKAKNVATERNHKIIDKSDFTEAYLQITTGRPASKHIPEHSKEIVTSHECGHAITLQVMYDLAKKQNIPWHLPDKVNFITLDPRGYFGGAMYHKNSENEEYCFEKMFAGIVCSYGGSSCEKHFFNIDGSYGITSDLEHATGSATAAIQEMGLGPNMGKISIVPSLFNPVSSRILRNIDKDREVFLKNALLVSDKIVDVYEGYIKEFTDRYKHLVGTGECLVQGDTFQKELYDWMAAHPEKQQAFDDLNKQILQIIENSKKGELVKS